MKEGVYVGPMGQLIEVFFHLDEGMWHMELSLACSDTQSFWLENGSMSHEILYLVKGYEYLGEL